MYTVYLETSQVEGHSKRHRWPSRIHNTCLISCCASRKSLAHYFPSICSYVTNLLFLSSWSPWYRSFFLFRANISNKDCSEFFFVSVFVQNRRTLFVGVLWIIFFSNFLWYLSWPDTHSFLLWIPYVLCQTFLSSVFCCFFSNLTSFFSLSLSCSTF